MVESREQKKPSPPPEPEVMLSALVECKNTAQSPGRELGNPTPQAMQSAIVTIQKAKKN